MNRQSEQTWEAARREAIDWLLRLELPQATELDWLAFQAWLEIAPEHLGAFEQAQRVSDELAGAAPDLLRALDVRASPAAPRRRPGRRVQQWTRVWPTAAGLSAAAAALLVVVAVRQPPPAPTDISQTAKGESRTLNLADGTRINLNSASRLSVRLERNARYVDLAEGEAAFDVAKDSKRPFLIAAGEQTIRVVGTEFDVLRHQGRLRVTVRRGVVAVQPSDGAAQTEPVLLKVGDQFEHQAGSRISTVQRVDPEAAFAWREGELIYRNQPLNDVVEDLNRYYATPVRVTGSAATLRFSGVVKIDAEADVVRRLQGFLHLAVDHRPDGFTLRLNEAPR